MRVEELSDMAANLTEFTIPHNLDSCNLFTESQIVHQINQSDLFHTRQDAMGIRSG
jgi:hypothetical protein